mmetsp:Transcript_25711/g.24991  ORF Transcript_25711/g.24991 Transcript_25711/m.24991 type:complete len:96 (+) Transcript_25711:831-1118(+)
MGAAGGVVAALISSFHNAHVLSGMELVSKVCDLEALISDQNVVLTGEGSFDDQTFDGKVVNKILQICKEKHIPLILLNGINRLNKAKMESLLQEE